MEKINQLIEIVHDPAKRKLRARCIQDGRWVRFPNKLRVENKVFKAGKMKQIRGSHWSASDISEFNLNEKNLDIENVLGLKNKAILKKFYDVIKNDNKINTEMLNIIFTVKNIFPDINEQIIEPLIKTYSHSAFIKEDLIVDVQNMLMNYNQKRVISLFSNYVEDDFLEDTVIMYKDLFENDILIDDILPKKPKNIRELHTLFTRECRKIKQPKSMLNQKRIDNLQNLVIDEYKVFIPETTFDLIDIGNALSICVGNGYYAKKVLKKQCNIIALKKGKDFKFCVEFDINHLIQCRGWGNASMNNNLVKKIKEIIYKKEKKVA